MRITILGGGPAGLYFALLMKQRDPAHAVTIVERDGPDDTFGWGIVFSDQTFDYLRESDAPSFHAITSACEKWDNVDIVHRGERVARLRCLASCRRPPQRRNGESSGGEQRLQHEHRSSFACGRGDGRGPARRRRHGFP